MMKKIKNTGKSINSKKVIFFIYAKLLRIKAVVLRTLIRNPAEI